jgi:hemin uptake protein HemP
LESKDLPASPITGGSARRIETAALLEGRSEVILLHRGEEYRLRVTKSGKLILTK